MCLIAHSLVGHEPQVCLIAHSLVGHEPQVCLIAHSLVGHEPQVCLIAHSLVGLEPQVCLIAHSLVGHEPQVCLIAHSLVGHEPQVCLIAHSLVGHEPQVCLIAHSLVGHEPQVCLIACSSVHTGSSSFLYKRGINVVMKKLEANSPICIERIKVEKFIDITQYVCNYTNSNECQETEYFTFVYHEFSPHRKEGHHPMYHKLCLKILNILVTLTLISIAL